MLSQIRKCDAATEQEEAGSEWHCTSLPDKMSGPRLKTPLLFLLLLSSLTGKAFCEGEDEDAKSDMDTSPTTPVQESEISDPVLDDTTTADPSTTTLNTADDGTNESGSGEASTLPVSDYNNETASGDEHKDVSLLFLIPVIVAVIIVGVIICAVVIVRHRSQKAGTQESSKEDPHLEGSSTEKVPMPMFEEDVPSVLELEMDELDQWMKKES